MSEETQAKWTARLWWKQHCSGFGSFAFFTSLCKFRHSLCLYSCKGKLPRVVTHTENCLNFHGSYVKKRWRKNLLGTIMKSHSFLHSKTESEIFFGSICWLHLEFLFFLLHFFLLHFYFFITGLLSTLHPTEDPVPPMHKEPAMHDPASKPQSLPVLSTKKVHCRWHESGWWVQYFNLKSLSYPVIAVWPNEQFRKLHLFHWIYQRTLLLYNRTVLCPWNGSTTWAVARKANVNECGSASLSTKSFQRCVCTKVTNTGDDKDFANFFWLANSQNLCFARNNHR